MCDGSCAPGDSHDLLFACSQSSSEGFRPLARISRETRRAGSKYARTKNNHHQVPEAEKARRGLGIMAERRRPRCGVHCSDVPIFAAQLLRTRVLSRHMLRRWLSIDSVARRPPQCRRALRSHGCLHTRRCGPVHLNDAARAELDVVRGESVVKPRKESRVAMLVVPASGEESIDCQTAELLMRVTGISRSSRNGWLYKDYA